jgi:hypothetical protein
VRDVASGIFIWVLLANRAPHLLGAFMAAASIIPVGDAVIVLRSGGTRAAAFGIHAREQPMTLPALAMVLDGVDRKSAAETCGMDRQTLRDWVHRYNAEGLRGLHDLKTPGPKPKLTVEQQADWPSWSRLGLIRPVMGWCAGGVWIRVTNWNDASSTSPERRSPSHTPLGTTPTRRQAPGVAPTICSLRTFRRITKSGVVRTCCNASGRLLKVAGMTWTPFSQVQPSVSLRSCRRSHG